ncbi:MULTISPECIES: hypothetical protein [Staphylococcus]|uniref:Competence protein ComGE n=1 Tax=Staphylococcus hsinchuensis TaxID=3051183 RepID=A0ABZ3ECJ9_9STAP|nr:MULTISPECIES: hypothetical protein [unclassified Staphylococcus]
MKKLKCEASLCLDALLSFALIMTICTIFIPMLKQQNMTTLNKLNDIEMKRRLITIIQNSSKNQLKSGISTDEYKIKLDAKKLCIAKKGTKDEKCYTKN